MYKRKISKLFLTTTLVLVIIMNLISPAAAVGPTTSSEYLILMDASTGQVLYEKNMDAALAPAGLVKILTSIIAIENTEDDPKLSATSTALLPSLSGTRSIGLSAGELINLSDCIYGSLLISANDAANVIAESVGGSLSSFVTLMNTRAAELGTKNSYFVNPNGLTETGQTSSPYDLSVILRHAMTNVSFLNYFGTTVHTLKPTNMRAQDKIIQTSCLLNRSSNYYYEHSTGGIIGNTTVSKYVLAATAEKDGRRLITVIMQSETEAKMYADAKALFEFGFNDFEPYEFTPNMFGTITIPVTEDAVKVGDATFFLQDPVNILFQNDFDTSKISAVALGLPSSIPKNSGAQYTANIVYDVDGLNIMLKPEVLLSMEIQLDPISSTPDTTPPSSIVTDKSGNPVTDESGNLVTTLIGTDGTPTGTGSKIAHFFKVFFIILLIIIGVIAGLILLGIGVLLIIKYTKRYKRKKAREKARAERNRDYMP